MKKSITLLLGLIVLTTTSWAQRSIDWSVDEFTEPTQLNSTASGTPLPVTTVLKNNGTDTAQVGDSVFYNFLVTTTNNQVILGFPSNNPANYAIRILNKKMEPGDTLHLNLSLSTTAIVTSSANVRFRISSLLINRGTTDPINIEDQAGLANNVSTVDGVWFNQQGWGVSIEEVNANDLIRVSPNPASSFININWIISNTVANDASLSVYDLQGKIISKHTLNGLSNDRVDISNLKTGMYMLRIENGDFTTTKKLQVVN